MRVAGHYTAAELRQFIRHKQRAPIVRRLQAVLGVLEGETAKKLVPRAQLSERVFRDWVSRTTGRAWPASKTGPRPQVAQRDRPLETQHHDQFVQQLQRAAQPRMISPYPMEHMPGPAPGRRLDQLIRQFAGRRSFGSRRSRGLPATVLMAARAKSFPQGSTDCIVSTAVASCFQEAMKFGTVAVARRDPVLNDVAYGSRLVGRASPRFQSRQRSSRR